MERRPSQQTGIKIAVDLLFVGRTDKVETVVLLGGKNK